MSEICIANEWGAVTGGTDEIVAQRGRSYAAIRVGLCEDVVVFRWLLLFAVLILLPIATGIVGLIPDLGIIACAVAIQRQRQSRPPPAVARIMRQLQLHRDELVVITLPHQNPAQDFRFGLIGPQAIRELFLSVSPIDPPIWNRSNLSTMEKAKLGFYVRVDVPGIHFLGIFAGYDAAMQVHHWVSLQNSLTQSDSARCQIWEKRRPASR